MHIHLGALRALVTFAEVVIVGFFWRILAAHLSQNPIGQAMAFIY
jgi:hypothetical protein